jgi:hypothetical protein
MFCPLKYVFDLVSRGYLDLLSKKMQLVSAVPGSVLTMEKATDGPIQQADSFVWEGK